MTFVLAIYDELREKKWARICWFWKIVISMRCLPKLLLVSSEDTIAYAIIEWTM